MKHIKATLLHLGKHKTFRLRLHDTDENGEISKISAEHKDILTDLWEGKDKKILYSNIPHLPNRESMYKSGI